MQPIQVYLDLPIIGALFGFLQDGTLLWMVAQIAAVKVKFIRLFLGGCVGGFFQFLLLTNQASSGVLNSWIISPWIFLILIPLVMNCLTFFPCSLRNWWRVLGYFYLLSLLLAGVHWGLDSINERFFQWQTSLFWRFIFHLSFIFVLGELGWGIVHRKIWEEICLYPIEIYWNNRNLKLNALLDTGNHLHDPLTKVPVIIIELEQIRDLLPKEVIDFTEGFNTQGLDNSLDLSRYWLDRIRVVPFHSLGTEDGILVGFRPDQLKVWQKQEEIISQNVVIAFYKHRLSPEGTFQALIPPTVLKER